MNRPGQFKRRNYFINKEFQGRYIFKYFLIAAIGSVLFMAVFSFFSSNTLSISYDDYQLQLGVTPLILFKKILSAQWVFIVVGGGVVVIATLFLTHRVAGPVFRFRRSLNEMIDGDLSGRIVLRPKDESKELGEKINEFNLLLSKKLSLIESANLNIEIFVHQLKKNMKDADMDISSFEPLLNQILESQKNISTTINSYTFTRKKV
ncbi:MAG: methyl-accepting chemotaxis protein [Deltaproteobacteria bacterium]|uniref:methyl-accepting chemotaxis protein n=1 Tax=Desulfobacula sp. TaxID=2593537 RepID=UPI0019C317B9|nr:methyl-accepting chemotaxis protein [Candidatus Desulfobacula maris]MBL6993444.1 methyl-accepting chemotaxis protein [Desulfobacula sp.]